ncbi:DNA fragmentation factor subunit beta [Aplysia californica]|uniref:DNAation factor subunit beta n=1 Tax=Aplysia californica TaxID=6500 RepID=A0ABM0K871_APLCA|nr:DNA fragmentation factor subunit beta [Aplysia californica]
MKPFTIQDSSSSRRIKIIAKNLADVINKGIEKLKIPAREEVTVVLENDGTIVDCSDSLRSLPDDTALVLLRAGEDWRGAGDQLYEALEKFSMSNLKMEITKRFHRRVLDGGKAYQILNSLSFLEESSDDFEKETRSEHKEWFEGLNEQFQTKTKYMRNLAQGRTRSYLRKAKENFDKVKDRTTKAHLQRLSEKLRLQLNKAEAHGDYFDRTVPRKQNRMCQDSGMFLCEGPYDCDQCPTAHSINPYVSKRNRMLFNLWNLDHIYEKSRAVIPTVLSAAKNIPEGHQLSCKEVYKYLFTRQNLKLVELSCHKKEARDQVLREDEFYESAGNDSVRA